MKWMELYLAELFWQIRIFVEKAEEKRYDEIAPCAGCGVGCVGEQTKRRPASCVINPLAGRELEFEEKPTAEEKNILVVGAGIGGLAAAKDSCKTRTSCSRI